MKISKQFKQAVKVGLRRKGDKERAFRLSIEANYEALRIESARVDAENEALALDSFGREYIRKVAA